LNPPLDPTKPPPPGTYNAQLEDNYTFVGVAYWKEVPPIMSRIFRSATECDSVAYAEVHVFLPKPRLVWKQPRPPSKREDTFFGTLDDPGTQEIEPCWVVGRQYSDYFPTDWNLYSQNWCCQLVPATQAGLDVILQNAPPNENMGDIKMPTLGNLKSEDIQKISPH
jgi:hypothetical protein